jgi:hypothetical protein
MSPVIWFPLGEGSERDLKKIGRIGSAEQRRGFLWLVPISSAFTVM